MSDSADPAQDSLHLTTIDLDRHQRATSARLWTWFGSPVSVIPLHAEQVSSSDGSGDDSSIYSHVGTRVGILNGFDVFGVFKVNVLAELNLSSRFSVSGRLFVSALSSMSSASFLIHGLLVPQRGNLVRHFLSRGTFFHEIKPELLEIFQNWAAAFLYFALGVILPNMARRSNVHLERTLSVAYRYNLNMRFGSAHMFFSYVLWPVTFLSGMFAPVLVWLQIDIWGLLSVFTWSIGMLFIGPSMVEEVGTVAVREVVAGVVKEVEDMRTQPISWQRLLDLVKATDFLLADTFDWNCLGRLIIFRISMLFLLTVGFGFIGIVHPDEASRKCAQVLGILSAICGCAILYRLGRISEKCSNSRPGSSNLTANLVLRMVEHELKHDSEESAFHQLSFYLRKRTIGIELVGTRITPEFAANVALRTCFYLPAAVAVIEGIWYTGDTTMKGDSRDTSEIRCLI
ncbi:unnamed protein product [Prorocentrum cordatum]|uniref:Solute carrier family 40 protein n=1 Tax=Prorocentrum cordatum TaxID=2364126 RepID=A0ABN9S3P2_9DINO|nr:unnamed protein product [Polarella glacialis]